MNDTVLRLCLAFILGSIIGFEREKKGRSAGFRTYILVCMGSALFMLVSLYVWESYHRLEDDIDPAKIAAGAATGIGFSGAGAIMRSIQQIRGLTTAASIWTSATIGLAVGCGYISAAIITTILVFIVLSFLKSIMSMIDKGGER